MNYTSRISKLAAIAFSVMAFASAVQAEIGKATVRAVRGKADVQQAGGWNALRTGMVLRPGAVIRTGSESQVDLFLEQNGPVVRVTENTELGLDKLNFESTGADTVIETQLDLKSGRILGSVKPMAPASRYEVKTPQGVAGIKGTDYDISAAGVVKIIEGQAVFAYLKDGRPTTAVVNTGEQFVPTEGRVQTIPASELPVIKRELESIKVSGGGPVVVVLPPGEPFISAVVGSSSSSPSGSSSSSSAAPGQ